MSLENYLAKSDRLLQEILNSFSQEEVEQLYTRVKEVGSVQYYVFLNQHLEDILKYTLLSESQRDRKIWVNNPDILLIRLGAAQLSYSTQQFLREFRQVCYHVDGGSYRDFCSVIVHALSSFLTQTKAFEFPFEGFENPFYDRS